MLRINKYPSPISILFLIFGMRFFLVMPFVRLFEYIIEGLFCRTKRCL